MEAVGSSKTLVGICMAHTPRRSKYKPSPLWKHKIKNGLIPHTYIYQHFIPCSIMYNQEHFFMMRLNDSLASLVIYGIYLDRMKWLKQKICIPNVKAIMSSSEWHGEGGIED
jgi:hypothetical protein